ncbi:hypothetical protein RHMOL_Rhmol04G0153200 [Rhododendron molle]|uniref:Uncharacterized protein n=1 Tax=Rhododendron molle TaxID=49168 RepID=A0ACC0P357_RHOML|nr:hypothetical protein RHMOL_Rhmol04G0153200 [Rhododendron molle]
MLSWSPPLFSPFGWPLEDSVSITHEENNFFTREAEANSSTPSFLNSPPLLSHEPLIVINSGEGECKNSNDEVDRECDDNIATTTPTITEKKLNHNASERDRRKRINDLYSSLRSLLPAADETKKLSIPATVSRVLKYIPDLQREVEGLVEKKEELVSRIHKSRRIQDLAHIKRRTKCVNQNTLSVVSASPLGEREVLIQICTIKVEESILISEILLNLEEDGLILLNASCFESFGDKIFYNIHLEVQGGQRVEFETLRERLLSFV